MDPEIIENTQIDNIPFTQETVQKKSLIQYAWVILFHFDINDNKPFSITRLRDFADSNFPWRGIKGEMTREFRIQLHNFTCFPDNQFFIFAKIQYGNINLLISPTLSLSLSLSLSRSLFLSFSLSRSLSLSLYIYIQNGASPTARPIHGPTNNSAETFLLAIFFSWSIALSGAVSRSAAV